MENFYSTQLNQQLAIVNRMTAMQKERSIKNRQYLESIMSCMGFCIQRGLALRGHRDDGAFKLNSDEEDIVNMGNFKALVAFRATTDQVLADRFNDQSSTYSKYISKTAQHDMLLCFKSVIQEAIVSEINTQLGKAIFAVSVDEVTDVSCSQQLAVVIRYVNTFGGVRERLLEYICMESITGKSISDTLAHTLAKHGLSVENCRAQTYDGAGNLSGEFKGCQAYIRKQQSLAKYFHCASHKLNLALNSSTKITEFRIMFENIKRLGIFYKYSPKRTNNLKGILASTPTTRTKVCFQLH